MNFLENDYYTETQNRNLFYFSPENLIKTLYKYQEDQTDFIEMSLNFKDVVATSIQSQGFSHSCDF